MPNIDVICGSFVEPEHEEKKEETVTRPVVGENVIVPNGTEREAMYSYELENIATHMVIAIPVSGCNIHRCEIGPCNPQEAKTAVLWVEQLEESLLLKNLSNQPLKIVRHLAGEDSIRIKLEEITQTIDVIGSSWIEIDEEKMNVMILGKSDSADISEIINENSITKLVEGNYIEFESGIRFIVKKKNVIKLNDDNMSKVESMPNDVPILGLFAGPDPEPDPEESILSDISECGDDIDDISGWGGDDEW